MPRTFTGGVYRRRSGPSWAHTTRSRSYTRGVDVRPADERDFEGIAEVRLSNGAAHDDSGVSAEYCRHLVEHERLWEAVESGRVLGYGGGVQVGDARLLSDLFVHAAGHGRGVGRAVLAEVLRGADHMFTFATDAPAAVPLYMRAGMVPLHPVITVEGDAQRVAGAVDHRHLRVIDIDVADAVAFERDVTALYLAEPDHVGLPEQHKDLHRLRHVGGFAIGSRNGL